jgi:hypothetical protein
MSDVKVKFGAEDVGLEKTLKSIQDELGTLKSKISAGDLSMTELEKTMKRVGQVESLEKRLKGMATEASQTSPKMDALGKDMKQMADKASDAGEKSSLSFGKLAAASAVGGLAVQAGAKVMELAMDAARAVTQKFGEALDLAGRLNDLKARTGETAGNLLVLERAFDNTGVSAEKVGPAINKLQNFMQDAANGGEKQTQAMNALGISMQDLQGKTPTEQLKIFAEKIAAIQDPTLRTATATDVFGEKLGGKLIPLMSNFSGEIDQAKKKLGSMPGVMDESAAAFDAIGDSFNESKAKLVEFAAGLLQVAAPALEKFTAMMSGVDAAGWGQRMGEMVMRIADVLLGAFKSPMPAIDAIGLALNVHIRNMGNLYLNAFVVGGNFLRDFWTSEVPNLITNRLGTSLMLAYANSQKLFVDSILSGIKSFNQDFGSAVSNVITFFGKSFSMVIKLMATDLFRALTDPLGFIGGKITSVLTDSINNGGLTFKSVFSQGIETSLGRLSDGLGKTADGYGRDLNESTGKIGEEWDKITGNLKTSSKDFFGAEPATARLTDKLKELETTGKDFRDQLTGATGEAGGDTKAVKDNLEVGANAMEKAAKEIKAVVSLSQTLAGDLEKFQKEDGIDPGGKLKKKFEEQKEAGRNVQAESTLRKIENNEKEQELRGFGDEKDRRSVKDIAREEGVETFRKSNEEIRQDIINKRNAKNQQAAEDAAGGDAKRRQEEMKPGKQGEKDKEPARQESGLSGILGEIKGLVDSINGKLPLHALGY